MAAETVRPGRKIGKVPALKLNWTITVTALSELELLNRKNFYASVETTFDARGNSVRELVNECKPIRVEFILWLQNELGAIPNAKACARTPWKCLLYQPRQRVWECPCKLKLFGTCGAVLPFGQWCFSSKIKHSPVRPRHSEAVYAVSFGNWSSRIGFIGSAI
jgi:hypothetical protein